MKKWLFGTLTLLGIGILAGCGPASFSELTGSPENGTPFSSQEDIDEAIPEEPTKEEISQKIKKANGNDIEGIIQDNFFLLDVVSSDNENAKVYATQRFTVSELVETITSVVEPDEKSELKDNQQILIYPNTFVTFKQSDIASNTVLMEVASDQFVRNNYSPNYLNTFFTFMLLNRMLDRNNWAQNRADQCRNGACYGGYTNGRNYSGGTTSKRGMSSFRGGGPSAGK
ncbi:DUF4247 domain-containing protein [Aquibacillus sp. 3ASR75-11]|uniref:DUF4247 domain-containing protein n=1 Tax=Terrihalobacillus insolitus TaxID=2950438 RepID=A0A9X4AMZ4_9BACI|nr:DUF4247 domain-containing protein [Terrihalobacillus insolitus]MDC3412650.1 DUF4247 domain-containing protein [Terrihalobacillus insolitus]MDC3424000.1 DUF4247 domain-containing protein [Terrihalobacillus insolitus]